MSFGPCMCGDTQCPSCGPAQGYDPKYEALYNLIEDKLTKANLFEGLLTESQQDDLLEVIVNKISTYLSAQEHDKERELAKQMDEDEREYQQWLIENYS